MSNSLPSSGKFTVSAAGIEFHDDLTFEEWSEIGEEIARAGRSLGFLIGDWINYGESRKDYGDKYAEALKATGFDYGTLRNYSNVARRVKLSLRNDNLSWEHHRKVAPLKDEAQQKKWLQTASKAKEKGKPMSTRRLAKSILLGRVARDTDMSVPENDRGRDNVHPHVNRLVAFWGKLKREGYLENADVELMKCMMIDISPVLKIYDELEARVAEIDSQSST